MKTRIISLLLAAVLIFAAAGCGMNPKAEAQASKTGAAAVQTTTAQAAEKQGNTVKADPAAAKTTEPAAQQTTEPAAQPAGASNAQTAGTDSPAPIFRLETEDFILTITGIADGTGHPFFGDYYEISYTFENKTGKKVIMDWGFIAVCHCMMPQGVCEWVEPGQTISGSFDLMKVFLEYYGIESPDEVMFRLEVSEDGNEDADPIFKQYVTFYPTGKTAADIPALTHTPVEGEIVLADTDEFSFILLPGQYDGGVETVFEILLINKTDSDLRFKWRDIFANSYYAGGHYSEDNFTNGTVLSPHSQEKNYFYAYTGGVMHFGYMTVDHLEFTLDVFDLPLQGEETRIFSAPLEVYPTGLAPQDVVVPVCPETPEQKVLFENEDLTVILLDEFQGGYAERFLSFYLENRTDKDAVILLHDIMIDDLEGRNDESLHIPAGQKAVMLLNVDPIIQQFDPERSPEHFIFQLDIRLTGEENSELVKDAEFEIQFSEVPLEERLQEDEGWIR
ncbi:MAG: hypothetical protein J5493_07860 [Lachnospiraceae bacterium]|nr:hypothetical protein [Lachnospiraceae bacterium]